MPLLQFHMLEPSQGRAALFFPPSVLHICWFPRLSTRIWLMAALARSNGTRYLWDQEYDMGHDLLQTPLFRHHEGH